jgi:hypothetical protein
MHYCFPGLSCLQLLWSFVVGCVALRPNISFKADGCAAA